MQSYFPPLPPRRSWSTTIEWLIRAVDVCSHALQRIGGRLHIICAVVTRGELVNSSKKGVGADVWIGRQFLDDEPLHTGLSSSDGAADVVDDLEGGGAKGGTSDDAEVSITRQQTGDVVEAVQWAEVQHARVGL